MPNTRRSKVERLPKSERHHPTSKLILFSPPASPSPTPSPSSPRHPPPSLPPTPRPRPPRLDDAALAKVLKAAGPRALLSAQRVSVQWRAVARALARDVSHLDLSRLFLTSDTRRLPPPTYAHLAAVLAAFPSVERLVLQRWPYHDVMPDVAAHLCATLHSDALRDVQFAGVMLAARDLAALCRRCPKLDTVRLGGHPSITDDFLERFAAAYDAEGRSTRMRCIALNWAHKVNGRGVNAVLKAISPDIFTARECERLHKVSWISRRTEPMEKLILTACAGLRSFDMTIGRRAEDVYELNLSQCPQLQEIGFHALAPDPNSDAILNLRKLNLTGCKRLHNIKVPTQEEPHLFSNLEELVLFGVNIGPVQFSNTFGLGRSTCALPQLQRLILSGCRLDTLRLIGYQHLTHVDVAGCPQLHTLQMQDCWEMQTLVVEGRKVPYRLVNLVLPVKCDVRTRRKQWYWESYGSNQTITFPAQ